MTSNNICSTSLPKEELQRLDSLYNREYSEDVKDNMYDYSVDSDIVNNCLRNHEGKWNSELEDKYALDSSQFKNIVKDLDNNQVKLVEDCILYRGLKDNAKKFKIGQKIPNKGYVSTSFDKEVAEYFAEKNGTILHIDSFKGTKSVYIRQNSKYPEQVEFLLPRNTELVIYDKQGNDVYCRINYLY